MKRVIAAAVSALCATACQSPPPAQPLEDAALARTELYAAHNGDVLNMLRCAAEAKKVVLVAHRGGFGPGFPENALETAQQSISKSDAVIELDIVSTQDGIDWLNHDSTLDRTTTGQGRIDQTNWASIRNLFLRDNAGIISSFRPTTFDEAIEHLAGKAFLMLDLKSPFDIGGLVRRVDQAEMLQSTVFIVYNFEQARQVRAAAPFATLALGVDGNAKLDLIQAAGLANKPFVALADDISRREPFADNVANKGSFVLGKSYSADEQIDAAMQKGDRVEDFDRAAERGYQLIVSNNVISANTYLSNQDLALRAGDCPLH